ncbi:MAG: tetratricopeptide repeat protein, partial [Lentisphaeria bacterium]|nr:tetratricopeptide repeat protein [Lentisphaeria bacterium]
MKMRIDKCEHILKPSFRNGVFFLACSGLLVLPVFTAAGQSKAVPAGKKDIPAAAAPGVVKYDLVKEAREREVVFLKSTEKEIDKLVSEALSDYRNGEFEKAISLYLDAKKKLIALRNSILKLDGLTEEALKSNLASYRNEKHIKRLNTKIEACDVAVSRSYYYWAQSIYFEAEKSAKAADFDLAIDTCRKAYEVYPPCKEEMEKVIARYKKLRDKAVEKSEFENVTSNAEETRKKSILIRQGEVLYSSGQWDKARSKFEQVISLDPYNEHSINYLRKINIKLSEAGRRRMELVHSERVVEAGWEALTPIIAYDDSGASGILQLDGVEKEMVKSPIQSKLSSIILPHGIDFPDSPLSAVLTTLVQYSKEYDTDPARNGINIVALGKFNASPNAGEGVVEKKEGENNQNQNQAADTPASRDPNVTLSIFNPITLGDAIKRVCENIKAVYKVNVEDGVVEIAPSIQDLEDALQTEYFELDNKMNPGDLLGGEGGASQTIHSTYFSTVPLPEGAYTALDPVAGRLIVTNTPENIAEMRKIFEKFNRPKPQILIQAKFVDVIMNDLEELGFQYTFSRENANV